MDGFFFFVYGFRLNEKECGVLLIFVSGICLMICNSVRIVGSIISHSNQLKGSFCDTLFNGGRTIRWNVTRCIQTTHWSVCSIVGLKQCGCAITLDESHVGSGSAAANPSLLDLINKSDKTVPAFLLVLPLLIKSEGEMYGREKCFCFYLYRRIAWIMLHMPRISSACTITMCWSDSISFYSAMRLI